MNRCKSCIMISKSNDCPLRNPPLSRCGWDVEENERRNHIRLNVDPDTGMHRKYLKEIKDKYEDLYIGFDSK